jgi:hypothetical protein
MAIFAGMGSKPHLRFLLNKKRKKERGCGHLIFFFSFAGWKKEGEQHLI